MDHIFNHVKIEAISGVVGKNPLNVQKLANSFCIPEKRIKRFIKTNGFEHLRVLSDNLSFGDMCVKASQSLLDSLNIPPSKIESFICASHSHDYFIPGTSYTIQNRIGLTKDCFLSDTVQSCPDFIFSIIHACSLIESNLCKNVLLCVGDIVDRRYPLSEDLSDYDSYLENSDGCACILFSYSHENNPIHISTQSYGEFYRSAFSPNFGMRSTRISESCDKYRVDGNLMNSFVLDTVSKHFSSFISNNKICMDELDYIVFQQTGNALIKALGSVLELPEEKCPFVSKEYGNMSSASIPISVLKLNENHKKTRSLVLHSFGVGLASAICKLNLNNTVFSSIIEM